MKAHVLLTLVVVVCVYWCPTHIVLWVFVVVGLLVFVVCTLCCQFLWILNWWLPHQYSMSFIYVPYYVWRVFDNVCIRTIKIKNELECSFIIYISFPSDTNKSNSLSKLYRWSFVALFRNLLILSNTISNILKQLIWIFITVLL